MYFTSAFYLPWRMWTIGKRATISYLVNTWECWKPRSLRRKAVCVFFMSECRGQRRKDLRNCIHEPVKLLVLELGECYGEITDISEHDAAVATMWPLMTGKRCMPAFDIDTRTARKRFNAMGSTLYAITTGAVNIALESYLSTWMPTAGC